MSCCHKLQLAFNAKRFIFESSSTFFIVNLFISWSLKWIYCRWLKRDTSINHHILCVVASHQTSCLKVYFSAGPSCVQTYLFNTQILNWASLHCNFTHSTLMLLIKRYESVVWLKSKPPILLQGGRSHCLPVMSWASSMSFQHICVNCSIISTNTNKARIN